MRTISVNLKFCICKYVNFPDFISLPQCCKSVRDNNMGYIGYPSIRDSALTCQEGFYLHIIKSPHRVKKMYEIKHFTVLHKYRWSQHKKPYHREHNVTLTNFSRPFLDHHYYKLSLHRSGEVDFQRNNVFAKHYEFGHARARELLAQVS